MRARIRPPSAPAPADRDAAAGVGERILSAATDLFYREGVRAVGIQRVIDEAGIAKASLYAHYQSKDDLVAACLARHAAGARAGIEARLARPGLDARGQLLALFDYQVDSVAGAAFRGCPFLNVTSEIAAPDHPAKRVIAAQRAWLHGLIAGLVADAGAASPRQLAGTLVVLFDGGSSSSVIDADPAAARHARWAAERLLDASLPPRARKKARARRRR
jgi:AcrR family transcriptional regulator